jgi:hypothetical protein
LARLAWTAPTVGLSCASAMARRSVMAVDVSNSLA